MLVAIVGAASLMAEPREQAFRAQFQALAVKHGIPGMAAGYVRGQDAPVVAVHGVLYKGSTRKVGPDAPWHIGSITKSFTATLIMRLAERGALSLDVPLGDLLPQWRGEMHPDWRAVTLNGLLSHSAGLAANFTRAEMAGDFGADLGAARLVRLRAHWVRPLPGRPGRFVYSNMGYVLAGLVAETIAGRPWQTLIRDEIATPLGLSSLGFGPPTGDGAPRGHRGWLMLKRSIAPDQKWADNPAWFGPAGTIHLRLADLLEWGRVQIRARRGELPGFLGAAAAERLHRPVTDGYALGWGLEPPDAEGPPVLGHDGSNSMWYASLIVWPQRDTVLALAMNQASGMRSRAITRELSKTVPGGD